MQRDIQVRWKRDEVKPAAASLPEKSYHSSEWSSAGSNSSAYVTNRPVQNQQAHSLQSRLVASKCFTDPRFRFYGTKLTNNTPLFPPLKIYFKRKKATEGIKISKPRSWNCSPKQINRWSWQIVFSDCLTVSEKNELCVFLFKKHKPWSHSLALCQWIKS